MSTTGSGEVGGDYSYDMVHADVAPQQDAPPGTTQGEAPVAGTADTGGDLSYDLAHGVGGSEA